MEINKFTDIMGVIVVEDIPEGRFVLLTGNTAYPVDSGNFDFGSREDLPGVKLPDTAAEAAKAKYMVTWPVNNSNAEGPIKLFIPTPSFPWAMRRGGWDQSANVPFSATVHLTYPGHKNGVTIPSGYQALAFDRGVFTVPSGQFIYNAALRTPGTAVRAADATSDSAAEAGLPAYDSGGTATVAVVERFDPSDFSLTLRTL